MTTSYALPDPDPNSQLINPSHAELHTATNHAVQDITNRVVALENTVGAATGPGGSVDQARLVTNVWTIPGALVPEQTEQILIPVIWNVGGRNADFVSAKVTVMTPPEGGDLLVDIVRAPVMDGSGYDTSGVMDSVLTSPLRVVAGAYASASLTQYDFVGQHNTDTWVSAVLVQVGSTSGGADLTIQLNRLL